LLTRESQKHQAGQSVARRFAVGASLFYASTLGMGGTYLPFFPVWLKAIGVDVSWIGVITAVPSLSRFTVLPFVTAFAERRQILRKAMIILAFATAFGFTLVGLLHHPLAILIVFGLMACAWTPLAPLIDGYALKGVVRYGLNYGPMRLWGSAAFIVGAMGAGLLLSTIDPRYLIWAIVAVAFLSAFVSLGLAPLDAPASAAPPARASGLLRRPLFLSIIGASALIQASHAAYYGFSAITWQNAGLGGLTIAALWSLGVIAEIVIFAISPRFTVSPTVLVMIGAASGVLALGDYRTGASDRVSCSRSTHARTDLRDHTGRDGCAAGSQRAASIARQRAGLSVCADRHHLQPDHGVLRTDLRAGRRGRLLRDGRDCACRRRCHDRRAQASRCASCDSGLAPEIGLRRIHGAAVVAQAVVAVLGEQ
jgi:MFS family permease